MAVNDNLINQENSETINLEESTVSSSRDQCLPTQKSPSTHVTILKRPSTSSDVPLITESLLSNEICIEDCTVNNVNFKRGTEPCIDIQVQENLGQVEGISEVAEDQITYDNVDPVQEEHPTPKVQNKEIESSQKEKLVCKNPKWVQMLGIPDEDKGESTSSKLWRTRSNRCT